MMTATAFLVLIWLHFFGDFILQSDRMAKGKSTNTFVLLEHVTWYGAALALAQFFIPFTWTWWAVNFALHFLTDFASSRATSYLWQKGERHWFFVVIGADQSLHSTALVLTYVWLV